MKAKEKFIPRPINAVRRKRFLAWREKYRKQQNKALVKAAALLKASGLTEPEFDFLSVVFKNRLGPRKDQIDRINRIWKKLKDRCVLTPKGD